MTHFCAEYFPDIQAMGDCVNCGHTYQTHIEPASPDQTTYRNKATGEEIDLTPAKEARFFDNRDPFEWDAVRGDDVHPVERELMEREGGR